ncbi:MAG: LapD/MoxY N-terminal periplasmic domain-containing protein [Pseudomonadota bacterium]
MTLFKQIALLVTAVFLVQFFVIVINDLERTGEYQQGQLQTTAQDMVTTLGIAITNLPDGNDKASLETLFNAIFDSGYYTRIELIANDGSTIHRKSQKLTVNGVPQWFVDLVPLRNARGSTQVMKGWIQLGRLNLELHPGFAYKSLYEGMTSTLLWFASFFGISLLLLWLVLRYVLEPLQAVTEQARAIHRNQFVQQQKIPRTLELKSVVEAMNLMVSKVQDIFDDQQKTLEKYQNLLYRDELTHLGNRQYMLDQLQQSIAEGSESQSSMTIIKIDDFELYRDQHGYESSDNVIKILADMLNSTSGDHGIDRIARFNDNEFAFLANVSENELSAYLQDLFDRFQNLAKSQSELEAIHLQAGICNLSSFTNAGDILSRIDYGLSTASSRGPFSIEWNLSNELELPQGKMQWRQWIESILGKNQLFLVGQAALTPDRLPVQHELFVRAKNDQDQIIPASAFMPMATSLGMSLDIDQRVFEMASNVTQLDIKTPVAINLSSAFFEMAEAQDNLQKLLDNCERNGRKLCIEASHHILTQHPIMREKISQKVRSSNHQFGIDNLDLSQSLQLLQSAQFDYIKINAKTLRDMANNDTSGGYQALRTITDTMDIRIIAVGVDSETLYQQLRDLGIEVMQGNYLGETDPVT